MNRPPPHESVCLCFFLLVPTLTQPIVSKQVGFFVMMKSTFPFSCIGESYSGPRRAARSDACGSLATASETEANTDTAQCVQSAVHGAKVVPLPTMSAFVLVALLPGC